MAKNAATLVFDKFSKVVAGLGALNSDVLVGVPAEKTNRSTEGGEAMNNATLAYIHDQGSPAAGIPARPFMRPGVETAHTKIVAALRSGALEALKGRPAAVERALNIAGLTAQSSIRGTINEGIGPELAAGTLAARKAKGFKGTKPLIVTGQLRNSINYVVRKK